MMEDGCSAVEACWRQYTDHRWCSHPTNDAFSKVSHLSRKGSHLSHFGLVSAEYTIGMSNNRTPSSTNVLQSRADTMIQRLTTDGYCVLPNFLSYNDVQTLNHETRILWSEGDFSQAAIGRGARSLNFGVVTIVVGGLYLLPLRP